MQTSISKPMIRFERGDSRTRTGCINGDLKGHGFSRAEKAQKIAGFSPWGMFFDASQDLCNQL